MPIHVSYGTHCRAFYKHGYTCNGIAGFIGNSSRQRTLLLSSGFILCTLVNTINICIECITAC